MQHVFGWSGMGSGWVVTTTIIFMVSGYREVGAIPLCMGLFSIF
jgi:hypothetical protein